ncbi:MAG: endonuclease III [Planctomycetes bacterium]|nr:endonuclease III [Planctomycetota bacterium]
MPRESKARKKQRAAEIIAALSDKYPDARCALDYTNPLELLVATILSAQCSDRQVNVVTKELFRKYPSVRAYAAADEEQFQRDIAGIGLFRNKARHIIAAARRMIEDFGGRVPRTMEELLTLPGVARKTANVVLGHAFGVQAGVVVDTHVARVAERLKLTSADGNRRDRIEKDLMELIPREQWTRAADLFIFLGRDTCRARKPDCERCAVRRYCPSADTAGAKGPASRPGKKKKTAGKTATGKQTAGKKAAGRKSTAKKAAAKKSAGSAAAPAARARNRPR